MEEAKELKRPAMWNPTQTTASETEIRRFNNLEELTIWEHQSAANNLEGPACFASSHSSDSDALVTSQEQIN